MERTASTYDLEEEIDEDAVEGRDRRARDGR